MVAVLEQVPSSFSWLHLEEFFSQAGLFVRLASVIPCKGLSSAAHGQCEARCPLFWSQTAALRVCERLLAPKAERSRLEDLLIFYT